MKAFRNLFFFLILFFLFTSKNNSQTKQDSILVNEIAKIITEKIDTIKTEYYTILAFKDYPFQTASLFILSDVLLNEWQLPAINKFLFENNHSKNIDELSQRRIADSITTYYHRVEKIGKYHYGLYGNEPNNTNFISIDKKKLESIFGIKVEKNVTKTKELLLDQLIQYSRDDNYLLPENLIAGFNELGLMQREIMSIPILTDNDIHLLMKVSSIIEQDLINLLSTNIPIVQENFRNGSREHREEFIEYFYQWYLHIVNAVTNKLIDLGFIKVPVSRNFNFIVSPI